MDERNIPMSPLEKMVNNDKEQFYKDVEIETGPMTFTWDCLSPWAKKQWANKFWNRKGLTR